ncbi:MAG: DUF4105 domain-containing protein [Deltaproteobacteria bacterium]|nr:DUF4105 domain-containing protein [Deltaproteobacteria bacterium]
MATLVCVLTILATCLTSAHAASTNSLEKAIIIAKQKKLHLSPTWRSLLHYKNNTCYVNDPSFLLNRKGCSLEAELEASLSEIFENISEENENAICRFPARYYFLQRELAKENITLPTAHCKAFEEYLTRAPADTIGLAYASENVTKPASMMGHLFLKLAAIDKDGASVEHAVSYFTRIDTANIPMLIAKSFVLGMPSFFALMPYDEQIRKYRDIENQNVWEYSLNLSGEARKLIRYHIWELKDVKSKYLFAGYNCATVVYFILSLAEPVFLDQTYLWVTALDVAKQADKHGLIAGTVLYPSNIWKMRMLAGELDSTATASIYNAIERKDPRVLLLSENATTNFLQRELGSTIINHLQQHEQISLDDFNRLEQVFNDDHAESEPNLIDASKFKNPLFRPNDSQISFGYLWREDESYLKLNFLPASHKLTDDNRQSFSETELELGDISALVNIDTGSIILDELKLFSSISLVPSAPFADSLSGKLQIGVKRHYDRHLDSFLAGDVLAGLGLSKLLHDDLLVYSLANLGFGYGNEALYPYGYPEVGFVINELLDMKGVGSFKLICNQSQSSSCYTQSEISQSIFLNQTVSVNFEYKKLWDSTNDENTFEISLRRYF